MGRHELVAGELAEAVIAQPFREVVRGAARTGAVPQRAPGRGAAIDRRVPDRRSPRSSGIDLGAELRRLEIGHPRSRSGARSDGRPRPALAPRARVLSVQATASTAPRPAQAELEVLSAALDAAGPRPRVGGHRRAHRASARPGWSRSSCRCGRVESACPWHGEAVTRARRRRRGGRGSAILESMVDGAPAAPDPRHRQPPAAIGRRSVERVADPPVRAARGRPAGAGRSGHV